MERALIDSRIVQKFDEYYRKQITLDNVFYDDNSGLLKVEENALLLMRLLNITTFERARDVIEVHYGDKEDKELTILITAEEYQFRLQTTEWTRGSYAPVKTSKLWKRLSVKDMNEEQLQQRLRELVELAMKKLDADMVTCKYCKKKFPKEHVIKKNVCHDCASKHLHVVF